MAQRVESPPRSNRSAALLNHLARVAHTRADALLAERGLRTRHFVALTMVRDHGPFSQHGLAGALQMDKANVVGVLNDLERMDLVVRRRQPQDRRRHVVEITGAGRRLLGETETALGSVEDDLLAALSDRERETLYKLLRRASDGHIADCETATREWAAESQDAPG